MKLTALQSEVRKQINRINRLIRRYKKQGYTNVPEERTFSKKNAGTRELERLKKIGRKSLLKKSEYSGVETGGKTVKAEEVPKLRRQYRAEQKAKEKEEYIPDFNLLDGLRERLLGLPDYRYVGGRRQIDLSQEKNMLVEELDNITISLEADELEEYVKYINSVSSELSYQMDTWFYDSDEYRVRSAVSRIYTLITNRPMTIAESNKLNADFPDEEFEEIDL